jgi:hypothetical protein
MRALFGCDEGPEAPAGSEPPPCFVKLSSEANFRLLMAVRSQESLPLKRQFEPQI